MPRGNKFTSDGVLLAMELSEQTKQEIRHEVMYFERWRRHGSMNNDQKLALAIGFITALTALAYWAQHW